MCIPNLFSMELIIIIIWYLLTYVPCFSAKNLSFLYKTSYLISRKILNYFVSVVLGMTNKCMKSTNKSMQK